MKFIFFFSSLFIVHIAIGQQNYTAFPNTHRAEFESKFMEETRAYEVFLPMTYFFSDQGNYPVIYLVDGDYNFHYNTGVVEMLSSSAEKIPEVIVVSISDRGNANYRLNCAPPSSSGKPSNAENFMNFIEKELKAKIDKDYRTSGFNLLYGHSLGGLFVTHYMLNRPEDFDAYVAIDPSYWWDDYSIIERADSTFAARKEIGTKFYCSLADSKQMGVRQFVGKLDKYYPLGEDWKFYHFPDENHGSVAIPSLKSSLVDLFDGWYLSREAFYGFKDASEVIQFYKDFQNRYNTNFTLPPRNLANIIYFYFRKERTKDLDILEAQIAQHFPASLDEFYIQMATNLTENKAFNEAEDLILIKMKESPDFFKYPAQLAKLYYDQGKFKKSKKYSVLAIELAKKAQVRQWQMNELVSDLDLIRAKLK